MRLTRTSPILDMQHRPSITTLTLGCTKAGKGQEANGMGYSNILITLDGLSLAEHAIDYALLAAAPGATLHLLSIVEDLAVANAPLVTALNAEFALRYMHHGPSVREALPPGIEARHDYVDSLTGELRNQG